MGNFSKAFSGTIFGLKWNLKGKPIYMDADDLRTFESAEVTEGLYGPNLRINRKDGGYISKKISPRMDTTMLPIGTKVDLTKVALCTLTKPGADDIQNFEIDGYALPEYQNAE